VNRLTDEFIMERVKAGKLEYMTELFNRYHQPILNYLARCTGNLEDSRDLTQSVFLRILKYRASYDVSKGFKSWMYRIARNILHSHYSERKICTENIDNHSFLANIEVEENTNHEKLYRCLDQLNDEYRELIVLSKFQGLKYKEIAGIFSTTEASIKNKMFRAMDQLRTLFYKLEN